MSTFTFDGRPIPYAAGQSVAAALLAAGIVSWRATRVDGRPRGAFCGIGTCFDCLVVVGEVPNERACLLPARTGLVVRTQTGVGRVLD